MSRNKRNRRAYYDVLRADGLCRIGFDKGILLAAQSCLRKMRSMHYLDVMPEILIVLFVRVIHLTMLEYCLYISY